MRVRARHQQEERPGGGAGERLATPLLVRLALAGLAPFYPRLARPAQAQWPVAAPSPSSRPSDPPDGGRGAADGPVGWGLVVGYGRRRRPGPPAAEVMR